MLKINSYYATPLGYDSLLTELTETMAFFTANTAQCLPMTLFCDYYDISANSLFINEILFNRWGSEIQIKKIIHNSNLHDGQGAVMFFNLNSQGKPDNATIGVYIEQADVDVRSTYISPNNLVFG